MRTKTLQSLATSVLIGLGFFSTGCTDNNSTVFIQQVQAPSDECSYDNDPDATHIAKGYLDVNARLIYDAVFLVGNQLIKRGDDAQFKVETSRVVFNEAEIEVFDYNGGSLGAFSVPVSGFADPASGGTPGYGNAIVSLIDPATAAGLVGTNQTVVSRVKVFGESLGGTDVETGYFDFPIEVCTGCLTDTRVTADCSAAPEDIACPCTVGQDGPFDPRCSPATNPCN